MQVTPTHAPNDGAHAKDREQREQIDRFARSTSAAASRPARRREAGSEPQEHAAVLLFVPVLQRLRDQRQQPGV